MRQYEILRIQSKHGIYEFSPEKCNAVMPDPGSWFGAGRILHPVTGRISLKVHCVPDFCRNGTLQCVFVCALVKKAYPGLV